MPCRLTIQIDETNHGGDVTALGTVAHIAQVACTVAGFNQSVVVVVGKTGYYAVPYIIDTRSFRSQITQGGTGTNRTSIIEYKTSSAAVAESMSAYGVGSSVRTAECVNIHMGCAVFYQTMVSARKARSVAHSAAHKSCAGTVADNTVCLVRSYKSGTALQVGIYRSGTILDKSVVRYDQSVGTALCCAHLTLYMAVADDGIFSGIVHQQCLTHTGHLGICYIQVLNGTAV